MAPRIADKVVLRVALVLEMIAKWTRNDRRDEAALTRIKANVNGADIDNDDLVQNHEDEARSLIRALVDATHVSRETSPDT